MSQSSRVIVRRSPVHGRGVFAKEPIRKGSRVGVYEGDETRRDGIHVLWLEDEEGNQTGVRGTNDLRFLNHSAEPNVEFRELEVFTLRRIESGEELTFHYGPEWADEDE